MCPFPTIAEVRSFRLDPRLVDFHPHFLLQNVLALLPFLLHGWNAHSSGNKLAAFRSDGPTCEPGQTRSRTGTDRSGRQCQSATARCRHSSLMTAVIDAAFNKARRRPGKIGFEDQWKDERSVPLSCTPVGDFFCCCSLQVSCLISSDRVGPGANTTVGDVFWIVQIAKRIRRGMIELVPWSVLLIVPKAEGRCHQDNSGRTTEALIDECSLSVAWRERLNIG